MRRGDPAGPSAPVANHDEISGIYRLAKSDFGRVTSARSKEVERANGGIEIRRFYQRNQ
jgi:hypothetical protein